MAWSTRTLSSVTTIVVLMSPHIIHGRHVSIKSNSKAINSADLVSMIVLDPRIMYEGLRIDCGADTLLLADLNALKSKLHSFYLTNYRKHPASSSRVPQRAFSDLGSSLSQPGHSPEKVNFTSRYQVKDRVAVNELEAYFKLPREDFGTCKPLQWWLGRRSQFPNLYRLVCDIFSIPGKSSTSDLFQNIKVQFLFLLSGSAVAVERIFSGGRDTISLRRASLNPDTIRVLMLVKQRLRLARLSLENDDAN